MAKPKTASDKPTLAQFHNCCGQCYYCHPIVANSKDVGCFFDRPEYLYGEKDDAEYSDNRPVSVTRPECGSFRLKNVN